jgi:two-component system, LytTR family, response regulator
MLKAVIVEDEPKGMANLKALISQYCDDVEIIGTATNIQEAQDLFDDPEFKPDIALLDISLPDGLVFTLLNELRPVDFEVIFVTAYDEYAKKACEYSSIGFISKPIDPDELKAAVKRARPRKQMMDKRLEVFSQVYNNPNAFEKMSIAALDGIYFVNLKDILRFEAEDNYTHIFLKSGDKITASKTIKAYEEMLQGLNFYRVHKRHVINLNYMRKFVKGDGGYLIMDDGKKIDVSRRRRPSFMEQMRRLQEEL